MRKFYAFITVIMVLSILVTACGSRRPGPVSIQLGPRISGVDVPDPAVNFGGEAFTFGVTVTGPPAVAWAWDFGGGAVPDTSTSSAPVVTLVNPSTEENASYSGTVTVWDADSRYDEMDFDYTVGPMQNQSPEFTDGPTFATTGNTATVTFTVNDGDDEDVTITLALTTTGSVSMSDTVINASLGDYGPFVVTLTNGSFDPADVTVDITLDDGTDTEDGMVSGTIAGLMPDNPDTILVVPTATEVAVGETFGITVYAYEVAFEVGYLNSIKVGYGGDYAVEPNYEDWTLTVDPPSWNLGAPGGDQWAKDGPFWEAVSSVILEVGARLFSWDDITTNTPWETLAVNVSLLGTPPSGAPAGTSGPIFYIEFVANEAGTVDFTFDHDGTYYSEPDGATQHFFTHEVGATITVS